MCMVSPDVSAQGVRFQIIVGNISGPVSGTSASTPLFAGIVSLLNDHRLRHGLGSMGWLNPWLYTIGWKGLNDITLGSNPGCNTGGWNATKGEYRFFESLEVMMVGIVTLYLLAHVRLGPNYWTWFAQLPSPQRTRAFRSVSFDS
jgi:subtilase family serine protease